MLEGVQGTDGRHRSPIASSLEGGAHDGCRFRPVVLVGHSYGGAVITEAGTHDKVAALVYIAAFAPDKGESVNTLIADPPPGAPVPPILPPRDGFPLLDREKFPASFAGDLPIEQATFMADSQVPWGVDALSGSISEPAWRSKSSWYLIAADDRMIPPPAQRAVSERAGSTTAESPEVTPSTSPNRARSPSSSTRLRPRCPPVLLGYGRLGAVAGMGWHDTPAHPGVGPSSGPTGCSAGTTLRGNQGRLEIAAAGGAGQSKAQGADPYLCALWSSAARTGNAPCRG
jgi:pimeloyl-ACP methyl ester carboxylesterase